MATIQVKNVPEETHRILRVRAAAAHRSLQEYLLALLIKEASTPPLDEVLDRARSCTGGSVTFDEAARLIRADRDRR